VREPGQPCDDFALTVSLPSDYAETHPNDVIRFTMSWADTGTGQSDYDLYVYKGTVTNTDGSEAAYTQSASGANPEITAIPVFDGTQTFTVKVVPFQPTAETVNVTIELASASGSGGASPMCTLALTAEAISRASQTGTPAWRMSRSARSV